MYPCRKSLVVVAAIAALIGAGPARAEYPERPIRAVVGFAAGTGADLLSRWFTEKLQAVSGNPVVVENKAGALGNIGTDLVAKARPDGYTILLNASSGMAGNRHIYRDLPFDTIKDFVPVTTFARIGFVLTVAASNPANSVAELTQQLKAKQGKATFGWGNTSGIASSVLYTSEAGIPVVSVSYKTNPAAVSDVAAGQIDFVFSDALFAIGQQKQGRVKILATGTPSRLASLPNVPTMAEVGLPNASIVPWWAVWVPAKTPADVITKLEKWINQIVAMPETREFLLAQGAEPLPGSSAAAAKMFVEADEAWAKIVKLAKIDPQ